MERRTRQSVRNGVLSMLVAAAVLLVANSGGLRTWTRGLPGNAATDVLVATIDRWHNLMQRVGIAAATTAVQDAVADFRDWSWPGADLHATGKADVSGDE